MEWLWVAQVTVNFLFLIGMVFWWTDRKSQRARAMEVQLRSTMAELERRATSLDAKARETQQRMNEQFSLIAAVGARAQALLARGREEIAQRLPTLEEQDPSHPPPGLKTRNTRPRMHLSGLKPSCVNNCFNFCSEGDLISG